MNCGDREIKLYRWCRDNACTVRKEQTGQASLPAGKAGLTPTKINY